MRQSTSIRARVLVRGAALLLCAFALVACKGGPSAAPDALAKPNGPDAKKEPDPVPVEIARASRRAVVASYTGTAPLEARAESQVVAKTSGVALAVLVEEGQTVRAGQPLLRLDSARHALQVAQSAAQLRKLEANYARSQQLAKQNLISANDLDQLRYDLENARATNRLANLELSYTTVVAPISGVVASRSIKTGNYVQINTPIMRIVDTSRLEAVLNVPERELATLKAGLPVTLAVDALPGQTFKGTVDRVSPVVDSGSGTFRVVASFEGGGVLKPGMFGRIRVDYDQRADALVVPREALLDDESDPAVYVVRERKAVRVPVKLGYLDGEWAEVRAGVREGEPVVTAGKAALRDGTLVQVIDPSGKPLAGAASTAKR